jgi:acyl-CoA synthetase (AMP-forming)/AMP-acid ligase II
VLHVGHHRQPEGRALQPPLDRAARLRAALPDALNCSARDVILPVVPMFHVNAWGLPYVAPMVGAKLVFPGAALDGKSLYELFEAEKVTCSAGVPTVWQGCWPTCEAERPEVLDDEAHGDRRLGLPAGDDPQAFQDKYGVHVLHAWGMTEMSPLGTVCTLQEPSTWPAGGGALAAGQAGPRDLRRRHEDRRRRRRELPWDGKAFGDLLVRGPWITASYFKGEGGDPLRRRDGRGWFPTGDVATIDADGYMQITDRSKDVIKSGGEWISSIDLENIAMAHPAVAMAACIAARTRSGTSARCWWW